LLLLLVGVLRVVSFSMLLLITLPALTVTKSDVTYSILGLWCSWAVCRPSILVLSAGPTAPAPDRAGCGFPSLRVLVCPSSCGRGAALLRVWL
jgi:hypothetical protein